MSSVNFKNNFDEGKPSISNTYSFHFSRPYLKNKKVLNIGCWTGGYEFYLNKETCLAVSLDISPKALAVARKKYPRISFVEGSVLKLPFKNELFDVITMWLTLEHLPPGTEKKAVAEIHRCLKKNGLFFASIPGNNWKNYFLDPAIYLRGHRRYGLKSIRIILKNKFKILKWEIKGGWFYAASCLYYLARKYLLGSRNESQWIEKKAATEFMGNYQNNFSEIYLICQKI